ncbi:MAG TPA: acetolactate synthase small subunit [Kofleriaceae bacterium]|nr:acetolactate synthase small subunit [Kofleriaceae bacterium]
MSPSIVKSRTIIAHVEDKPGVLNRIASLFRRRGFNIASLTVGRTAEPGVSRLTIVVDADDDTTRRIEANLYKLVNVLLVEDVSFGPAISRELALIKVRANAETRPRVLQVCDVFGARVVDMTPDLVTLEFTSTSDKIDDLASVLRVEGIVDMVRTGVVAMTRGEPRVIQAQEQEQWPESSTTATPISA